MRKFSVLLMIVAVMCVVPDSFASCTPRVALQYSGWDYAIDHLTSSTMDCWTCNVSYCPTWNSSAGMWEFDTYYTKTVQRVIDVPGGDSGSNSWNTLFDVDYYDPCASVSDFLAVDVDVNHGGSHTGAGQYAIYGNQSTSDSGYKIGYFNAVSGDTITVTVTGATSCGGSGGHVRIKDFWIERAE